MHHIIEYIGREGVKTSPAAHRMFRPQPGDPIRWPNGKIGRVEHFGSADGWPGVDEVHCCCDGGSVFWGWNEDKKRQTVSISGGPFTCVKIADLKPTYKLMTVRFWNWGDNSPGADQGVEYMVTRPLFEFAGESDNYDIMCSCEFKYSTCTRKLDPACLLHGQP